MDWVCEYIFLEVTPMVRELWISGVMHPWYYNEDDKKAYKNKGAAFHAYTGEERKVVKHNGTHYILCGNKYKTGTLGDEITFTGAQD